MADKTFAIAVSQSQARKIAEAIEVYAHSAYPVAAPIVLRSRAKPY